MSTIYEHWFKTCLFIATAGFWGFWIALAWRKGK